jgi:hypothetical protein
MTSEQFRKNEHLRTAMLESLAQGHMKMALAILRDLGTPREFSPPAGVDFMAFNAMQNARREGFYHALDALEGLATAPSKTLTTKDLMRDLAPE